METMIIHPANAATSAMYEESSVDDTNALYEEEAEPSPYSIRWFYRKIRLWFFRKIGKAGPLDPYLVSPSGDLYFSYPGNIRDLEEAEEESRLGKSTEMTIEEFMAGNW
jgi:hypothetical protein